MNLHTKCDIVVTNGGDYSDVLRMPKFTQPLECKERKLGRINMSNWID